MMLTVQDMLNQRVWSTTSATRDLDCNQDYTDPGERAAIEFVSSQVRGRPILDLGVGRGRTIPLLAPLTQDYRAIDYMQSMVDVSRKRFPGVDVSLGDARDLVAVPSAHFGLVQFSYNGIDAVSAEDRARVLREVRRVLAPGGLFLFSSLNLDGPAYRARPWHLTLPSVKSPLHFGVRLARTFAWTPVHVAKWLGLQRHRQSGNGYAIAPLPAHHWGLVAHYTSVERQLRELSEEGFAPDVVAFDNLYGRRLEPGASTSDYDHFHWVARKSER